MSASSTIPPVRRWDAVTRAIDSWRLGPVTIPMAVALAVLIVGSWLTLLAATGRETLVVVPIAIAGAVVTGILASAANAFARPPARRRAFEAFAYLGEWEMDRFARMAERPITPTIDAMRKLLEGLEDHADYRWLRVELLTVSGDLQAARVMAERMPEDTPYRRVERIAALVLLDWLLGEPGDPGPIRAAVDEVEPADGVARRCAEVILACSEVRYRVGRGDADPTEPLRVARDRLGRAADDVLIRMTRRSTQSFVVTAAWFVVLLLLLDWLGIL